MLVKRTTLAPWRPGDALAPCDRFSKRTWRTVPRLVTSVVRRVAETKRLLRSCTSRSTKRKSSRPRGRAVGSVAVGDTASTPETFMGTGSNGTQVRIFYNPVVFQVP